MEAWRGTGITGLLCAAGFRSSHARMRKKAPCTTGQTPDYPSRRAWTTTHGQRILIHTETSVRDHVVTTRFIVQTKLVNHTTQIASRVGSGVRGELVACNRYL